MNSENRDILEREDMKSNPFGTPAGYFESLEDSIMARIRNGEGISADEAVQKAGIAGGASKGTKGIAWKHIFRSTASLAASFALILALGYGVMEITRKASSAGNEQIVAVSPSEYDTTLAGNYDLSSDEILADTDADVASEQDEEISPIEQYLLDSDLSIYSIAYAE